MQRQGLIPSIEGLRALAVLAVLLFHLDVTGMQGGFLGVDVFFVISGFVITRSILQQSDDGSFKLSAFYYARFRRLIPALATVTLVTLVSALPLLPALDLEAAGESALYSALSLSNLLFWSQAGYFDAAAHTKPFLHTWSLGVEEQFYLFWPVALLALLRSRALLTVTCGFLALASVAGAAWFVFDHPSAVFFLTPFRVYQFMFGAMIASATWNLAGRAGSGVHLLGLCCFAAASIVISGEDSPLLAGGVAAAASFLLILGRESPVARVFTGNAAFVWIGQRSYAIYLVHWPLILLYKYATGPVLSLVEQVGLGVASILGAMVLHRYVERPFRQSAIPGRSLSASVAMPATVLMVIVGMFIAANYWGRRGFPENQAEDINAIVGKAKTDFDQRLHSVRTGICHATSNFKFPEDYDEAACAPIRRGGRNVLVIGDSIAADIFLMLRQAYPDVTFSQATGGSCPAFVGLGKYTGCKKLNDFRFNVLARRDYDYVVVAGYWRESTVRFIPQSVDTLKSYGRKVVFFGPGVEFQADVLRTASMSASIHEAERRMREGENRKISLNQLVRNAASGTKYVDLGQIQCHPECDVTGNNALFYVDKFHLSPAGVEHFGDRLARSYPDLFRD